MRLALIDADILAYQAATVSEQPIDWGDGMWTLHAFEADAMRAFSFGLNGILDAVEPDNFLLVFSDTENWRKEVLPTYKGNRAGVRKPMLIKYLRNMLMEDYDYRMIPTLEGDDVIGILATSTPDTIVCSLDKDFKSVPGKHYNFGRNEFFEVNEHQADLYHMEQALTGDPTDGYAGCPGVGAVTAKKILAAAIEEGTPWANRKELQAIMWKHVVKAYAKAGLGEEEALVQARVARILRYEDYDDVNNKVRLWTPPNIKSAALTT